MACLAKSLSSILDSRNGNHPFPVYRYRMVCSHTELPVNPCPLVPLNLFSQSAMMSVTELKWLGICVLNNNYLVGIDKNNLVQIQWEEHIQK